jgi:hypothetical protein
MDSLGCIEDFKLACLVFLYTELSILEDMTLERDLFSEMTKPKEKQGSSRDTYLLNSLPQLLKLFHSHSIPLEEDS